LAVESLETGDRIKTFAEIAAQNVHLDMPVVKIDKTVVDGDTIEIGGQRLEVWHTPGHTDSQLAFRMGTLLLSGDNIYRDGSVGAIDAHHGSDIFSDRGERCGMASAEPWTNLSEGQPPVGQDDQPT